MITLYCKGYIKPSYPVYVSENETFKDMPGLFPVTQKRFIVIDQKIVERFPECVKQLQGGETHLFPITATEEHKSLQGLNELFDAIFALKPNRDDIVIAIGGGLVMNLGGLAASLIMRGMRFYYVPTTLTGQIDACLGSKQAVNFKGAKNWLGMFNDPEFCYINPHFLSSVPVRELKSQAIEGVKLCLATNKALFLDTFEDLSRFSGTPSPALTTFITKMIETKIAVVQRDLPELHYGMSMLYGHTIGHAIEMIDHKHISHGEGVGLGMLAAARISYMLGIADKSLVDVHKNILERLGLPLTIPRHITVSKIVEKLAHNKKNYGGNIHFVLLKDIGEMAEHDGKYFTIVPWGVINSAIEQGY